MMFIIARGLFILMMNMIAGLIFVYPVKVFLFYPRKPLHWRGRTIPFTPGYLYRKKVWLIGFLRGYLETYLRESDDEEDEKTRIYRWELKAYESVSGYVEFVDRIRWIPGFFKGGLRDLLQMLIFEFIRKFLRTLVPFLLDKYRVSSWIELLDRKLDVDQIFEYFIQYVYINVVRVIMILGLLSGLMNMILFWILV